MVMSQTSLSQLESDPHSTELWDLMNTLGLLKPNRLILWTWTLSEAGLATEAEL